MMKIHATEKMKNKRQKTQRKPELYPRVLMFSTHFNSADLKLRLFCSTTYSYCDLARPNYFYCLKSNAQSCADIPVFHVSIGIWWHKKINLVQIYLPFPISNTALTFRKESLFMLAGHISTQHSLWKLLYPAVDLSFLNHIQTWPKETILMM